MNFILSIFFFSLLYFPFDSKAAVENFSVTLYESDHNGKNDSYHKDKKRKTILAVPASVRPDDLTLIVWFHGLNGFSEKTFERVFSQVKRLADDGKSVAVVIPEMPWSSMTKTPRSRQGRIWKKKDQFKRFLNEAMTILDKKVTKLTGHKPINTEVIIVGHSAGGSAIASASREGSLCDSRVTHVVWSDASYGSWLEKAHLGCLKDSKITQKVIVRKWDSPHKNALKFYKNYKNIENHDFIVLNRRKYTHGAIGDNALELSKLFPPGC